MSNFYFILQSLQVKVYRCVVCSQQENANADMDGKTHILLTTCVLVFILRSLFWFYVSLLATKRKTTIPISALEGAALILVLKLERILSG